MAALELEKTISLMSYFIIIVLTILEFTRPSLYMINVCKCTLTTFPLMPGLDNIFTTFLIACSQNIPVISQNHT